MSESSRLLSLDRASRRDTRRVRAPALLVCTAVLLAGCSALGSRVAALQSPNVELAQVALDKADLLAPEFLVTLRVENPNDADIRVDGADATLELDGEPVASGASASPVNLKAHRQSAVEVRAAAGTLALARQLLKLDQQGHLDYVVTGHLTVAKWLGILGNVPFRVSGMVTREELFRGIEGLGGRF